MWYFLLVALLKMGVTVDQLIISINAGFCQMTIFFFFFILFQL